MQYSSAVFDESSIWTGFASGALSSIASSAFMGGSSFDANGNAISGSGIKGVAGSLGIEQTAGTLAFGALTGGNFWQGAVPKWSANIEYFLLNSNLAIVVKLSSSKSQVTKPSSIAGGVL